MQEQTLFAFRSIAFWSTHEAVASRPLWIKSTSELLPTTSKLTTEKLKPIHKEKKGTNKMTLRLTTGDDSFLGDYISDVHMKKQSANKFQIQPNTCRGTPVTSKLAQKVQWLMTLKALLKGRKPMLTLSHTPMSRVTVLSTLKRLARHQSQLRTLRGCSLWRCPVMKSLMSVLNNLNTRSQGFDQKRENERGK